MQQTTATAEMLRQRLAGDSSKPIPILALSVPAAAVATGRSRARMFELIRLGAIKAKKDGASTLIETAELERWLGSLPDRQVAA